MNNQTKFVSAVQFFAGSLFLFMGLLGFKSALTYNGLENDFLADNWGTPLIMLMIVVFGLGWWFENFTEYLTLSLGRKIAVVTVIGFFLVFGLIGFGSLMFIPLGFSQYALS